MKNETVKGFLPNRLDMHFAALAAVGAVAGIGMTDKAEAAIISSGPVNINIPSTTAGVYLNVVTGANSAAPASAPGWDVNPWSSSTLAFFNPSAPAGGSYVTAATVPTNLAGGTLIDAASTYGAGNADASFVLNSSNNFVGFRFFNEADSQVHFGWMQISIGSSLSAQPRAIVAYAYEDQAGVGINAGAIPAPASAGLLVLGAAGLGTRRRKA